MLLLSAKYSRSFWQMGKHLANEDSENRLKDRSFRLEQGSNIIRCLQRTSQGSTNLGRKSYQEYSSDTHLVAERIWKRDIIVAEMEELGKLDASEIHVRRLNAKRSI